MPTKHLIERAVKASRRPDGNVMVVRYSRVDGNKEGYSEYLDSAGEWVRFRPYELLPEDATLIPLEIKP